MNLCCSQVFSAEANEHGNYIERALSEGENEPGSIFGTEDGKNYISANMMDLFAAGRNGKRLFLWS